MSFSENQIRISQNTHKKTQIFFDFPQKNSNLFYTWENRQKMLIEKNKLKKSIRIIVFSLVCWDLFELINGGKLEEYLGNCKENTVGIRWVDVQF